MRRLVAQFARFGVVGGVGLVIDVTVFNVLRATVLDPHEVPHGQLWANVISTCIAVLANWLGNRYWTFRHAKRSRWAWEAVEFAIVSLGGLGISLLCLWVSNYVLGFTGVIADNIAKNVVGLALGTLFRFTFYRLWVFRGDRAPAVEILGVSLPEEEIGTGSIATLPQDGTAMGSARSRSPGATADPATVRPSASSRRVPPPAPAGGEPRRG